MSVKKTQKTCTGRSLAQFENSASKSGKIVTIKGGNTKEPGHSEIIIS